MSFQFQNTFSAAPFKNIILKNIDYSLWGIISQIALFSEVRTLCDPVEKKTNKNVLLYGMKGLIFVYFTACDMTPLLFTGL